MSKQVKKKTINTNITNITWKRVCQDPWTEVALVPGGHVMRVCEVDDGNSYVTAMGMIFIPHGEKHAEDVE